MGLGIASFSRFITDMNHRARSDDAEGLARWAVSELSDTLGFDAAWYGWATLRQEGVEFLTELRAAPWQAETRFCEVRDSEGNRIVIVDRSHGSRPDGN